MLKSDLGSTVDGLFIEACGNGDVSLMETIIIEGESQESLDQVDSRIVKRVDFNRRINGDTPLMTAARNGHINVIKLLMKQPELDLNVIGGQHKTTALMIAFSKQNSELCSKMLALDQEKKIDVNIPGKNGETVLIRACILNEMRIVYQLMEYESIDVNAKNLNGETAFDIAFFKGFKDLVAILKKSIKK